MCAHCERAFAISNHAQTRTNTNNGNKHRRQKDFSDFQTRALIYINRVRDNKSIRNIEYRDGNTLLYEKEENTRNKTKLFAGLDKDKK